MRCSEFVDQPEGADMFRRSRRVARASVVAAVVCLGLLGVQGSASAAGGDTLYVAGGQGYASWTWSSSNYANITNLTKLAWDTSCNASGVYTYIVILQTVSSYTGPRVNDACSGGASSTSGGTFSGSNNIKGIRVYVCEDVTGSDICSSQYYDSPYT